MFVWKVRRYLVSAKVLGTDGVQYARTLRLPIKFPLKYSGVEVSD